MKGDVIYGRHGLPYTARQSCPECRRLAEAYVPGTPGQSVPEPPPPWPLDPRQST